MKSKTREPLPLDFERSHFRGSEEGALKNMGFDRFRHDKGDIPSLSGASRSISSLPKSSPDLSLMIVHEAVPVDDVDFIVVDEESGIRLLHTIFENGYVILRTKCNFHQLVRKMPLSKSTILRIPLSEVIDWVKDCKFRNFGKWAKRSSS